MTLPKGKKLKISDVHDNFKDYNFLIFTNMGTVDTSEYDVCIKKQEAVMGSPATTQKYQFIKKRPVTAKATTTGFHTTDMDNKPETSVAIDAIITLYDDILVPGEKQPNVGLSMIEKILVKSKRNFLGNQTPDKYVQKL